MIELFQSGTGDMQVVGCECGNLYKNAAALRTKGWPNFTMDILVAHLNTSRTTKMYLTNLELADIGCQNVVYHINLSSLVLLRSHETFCIVQYGLVQYTGILLQWRSHLVPV